MGKGPQTREAILKAALEEASVAGLGGLSIGGLARRVGLSKSGLFAHFASKENLQVAVVQAAAERFASEVFIPTLGAARGRPRLLALFEHWLRWASRELPGGCIFLATATELDDQPGPARDALVQTQLDWLATLSQAVRIAVEEGHLQPETDADEFARAWMSIIVAHGYFSRLLRDPKSESRSRAAFEALLESHRA